MERCPHCGAATRPGAKFCTSCGTRLDDRAGTQTTGAAWDDTSATEETQASPTAVTPDASSTEGTDAVTPPPNWSAATDDPKDEESESEASDAAIDAIWSKSSTEDDVTDASSKEVPATEGSSWFSKWPESTTTSDSPADRFREALDTEEATQEPETASTTEEHTFPATNRWSWGAPDDEAETEPEESATNSPTSTSDDIDDIAQESETITPPEGTSSTVEAATADNELVTDAPDDSSDDDARTRASALVDELRGLIWKIGEDESALPDENQTIIGNMKRVRGETSDFSDLRIVIEAVQEHPRDIDALRNLGEQADRLQALLDSHAALTSAVEAAIRQGR